MLLTTLIKQVYVPSRISLSKRYAAQLGESANAYGLYLGRRATTKDFKELVIAKFLASLADDQPATSINTYRSRLLALWEGAKEAKLVNRSPDRKLVRRLPEELDPPEAWNEDQVNRLMERAADQPGKICGVSAGEWWLSLTLAIYETSCRISAMLSVLPNHYDGVGILVRKQKNHRPQWYRLSPEACQMIEQVQQERRIWNHLWHPRTVWAKFRDIVEAAGLPAPKTGRQLFHRLRRTTITFCAAADPAIAQRTAGHADYATTLKHYIDPRLIGGRCAVDVLPDPLRLLRAKQENQKRQPAPLLYCSEKPNLRIYG